MGNTVDPEGTPNLPIVDNERSEHIGDVEGLRLLKFVRVDLEFVPRKIRSSPDANWGDMHESHTSRQSRRGYRNPDYNNASLVISECDKSVAEPKFFRCVYKLQKMRNGKRQLG